jgi:hypothetical protein
MDTKQVFSLAALLTVQSMPPTMAQENYNWQGCIPSKFGKVCFAVSSNTQEFTTRFRVKGKRYTLQGAAVVGDPKHPKSGAPLCTFSPDGRGMIFEAAQLRGLVPPVRTYYLAVDTKTGFVYSADGAILHQGNAFEYAQFSHNEIRWLPEQPHTWAIVQPDGSLNDPVQLPN